MKTFFLALALTLLAQGAHAAISCQIKGTSRSAGVADLDRGVQKIFVEGEEGVGYYTIIRRDNYVIEGRNIVLDIGEKRLNFKGKEFTLKNCRYID